MKNCPKMFIIEYLYYVEDTDNMPIITLEVMQDSSLPENVPYDSFYADTQNNNPKEEDTKESAGMNFLIDKNDKSANMHFITEEHEDASETNENQKDQEASTDPLKVRTDLLEYTIRSDGSVCCKICRKVLSSRTHWYRHKYKAHVMHSMNPAPLFQCEQCLIFFKSRKGYIGHIASRHSETLQDASPVLTNAQAEAAKEKDSTMKPDLTEPDVKKEPDPELVIPKAVVLNYQNTGTKQTATKSTDTAKKSVRCNLRGENEKEWEERRTREDRLVADIIARVRRECEEQGEGGPTRRGYARKSTPMQT